MAASGTDSLYKLRHRPPSDKLVDTGFRNLVMILALMVALILLGIFLVVGGQAWQAMQAFGINFIFSSTWDPVRDVYGAFTAIYGTLLTSLLALVFAVPCQGTHVGCGALRKWGLPSFDVLERWGPTAFSSQTNRYVGECAWFNRFQVSHMIILFFCPSR